MSDQASTHAQPAAPGAAAAPWAGADSIGHATWARLVEPGLAISRPARGGGIAMADATGIHDRQMSFLNGLSVGRVGLMGTGGHGWADDLRVFRMAYKRSIPLARAALPIGQGGHRPQALAPRAAVHEPEPADEPVRATAIVAADGSASPPDSTSLAASVSMGGRASPAASALPVVARPMPTAVLARKELASDAAASPSAAALPIVIGHAADVIHDAAPARVDRVVMADASLSASVPAKPLPPPASLIAWRTPPATNPSAGASIPQAPNGAVAATNVGDAVLPTAAATATDPMAPLPVLPVLQRRIDAAPMLPLSLPAARMVSTSPDPARRPHAAAVGFVDVAGPNRLTHRSADAAALQALRSSAPGGNVTPRQSPQAVAGPLARSVAAAIASANASSAPSGAAAAGSLAGSPTVGTSDVSAEPWLAASSSSGVVVTPRLAPAQAALARASLGAQRAVVEASAAAPAFQSAAGDTPAIAAHPGADHPGSPQESTHEEMASAAPDVAAALVVAVPAASLPAAPAMPLVASGSVVQASSAAAPGAAVPMLPHQGPPAALPVDVALPSQGHPADREPALVPRQPLVIEASQAVAAPVGTERPSPRVTDGATSAVPMPSAVGGLLLARSVTGAASAINPAFAASPPIAVAGATAWRAMRHQAGTEAPGIVFRDADRSAVAAGALTSERKGRPAVTPLAASQRPSQQEEMLSLSRVGAGSASAARTSMALSVEGMAAWIHRATPTAWPWVARVPDAGFVFLEHRPSPARSAWGHRPDTAGPLSTLSPPGASSGAVWTAGAADAITLDGAATAVDRTEYGATSHDPDVTAVSPVVVTPMMREFPLAPRAMRRANADAVSRQAAFGGGRAIAMPLVPIPTIAGASPGLAPALSRANAGTPSVPAAPYELPGAPAIADHTAATEASHQPASAAAPGAAVDIDEIVDRAWRAVMSRLAIERERRGYGRWA